MDRLILDRIHGAFMRLKFIEKYNTEFGFEIEGVDQEADVNPEVEIRDLVHV
ncbi:hypothetical protein [Pararobbsia alpina]|uniref:hypothetical protein n=1 Tax=Pararobbsia alpina TaxID=621374 RepID=UPI00158254A2|nr:hypothetical protein [Pararobbsia alpina]